MIALGALYLRHEPERLISKRWKEEIAVLRSSIVVAMFGFGLLAVTARWLISRSALPALKPSATEKPPRNEWRLFLIGVGIFTIASGILWARRLDSSLWSDEISTLRQYTVGRWRHYDGAEGTPKMIEPTWADTFFGYKTPNNHLTFSVTARVTHDLSGGINKTDFSKPYFNAFALRLPSFVAGLAAISLIGYLALRLHSLLAAWLAMGYATLHPWLLEFSTVARGYTFAMAFLALAVVAAVIIFRRGGGWRWWIIYGSAQLLAFCSVATLLHALILLNTTLLAALLFDRTNERPSRIAHIGAFFATNMPCAFIACTAFKPRLAQLKHYLTGQREPNFSFDWLTDCISYLLVGQPYASWEKSNPWAVATGHWHSLILIFATLLALTCCGLALHRASRSGVFVAGIALLYLLPPFTTFAQCKVMQLYLFPWYAAWQLPLWIVLFSSGAASLIHILRNKITLRHFQPAAAICLLLMIGIATHKPRNAYLSISYEPQKESAAVMRDSPNPYAPDHNAVITTSLVSPNYAYDPWNVRLKTIDVLWSKIAAAESTGKPLFCDTAWIQEAKVNHPECSAILFDERYFKLEKKFYGLQPQNSRYVYRYRPGSLTAELEKRNSLPDR